MRKLILVNLIASCIFLSGIRMGLPAGPKSVDIAFGLQLVPLPGEARPRETAAFSELPKVVRTGIINLYGTVLRRSNNPFAGEKGTVDREAHLYRAGAGKDPDLVEWSLEFRGQQVRVIRSPNGVRIHAEIPKDEDQREFVEALANHAFELQGRQPGSDAEYRVRIPWDQTGQKTIQLSSAPQQPIVSVGRWFDRFDVVIEDGTVSFLTYTVDDQHARPWPGDSLLPKSSNSRKP